MAWRFPFLRTLGQSPGSVVSADVTAPTLAVVSAEDGSTVTATITAATATDTIRLFYRTAGAAWTTGLTRTGNGTISQTGLSDGEDYQFLALADQSGVYSMPSTVQFVRSYTAGAATLDPMEPYESINTILKEWLAGWFDGAAHTINQTEVTFPDCAIETDRFNPERPLDKPIVGADVDEDPTESAWWNPHGGRTRRAELDVLFFVAVSEKLARATGKSAGRYCDQLAGMMQALLSDRTHELAANGLHMVKPVEGARNVRIGHGMACKEIAAHFYADLVFKR